MRIVTVLGADILFVVRVFCFRITTDICPIKLVCISSPRVGTRSRGRYGMSQLEKYERRIEQWELQATKYHHGATRSSVQYFLYENSDHRRAP